MDPAKFEALTEATGVQDLFAQATDAALSRNGLSSLVAFFANSPGAAAATGGDSPSALAPTSATTQSATKPSSAGETDVTALNQTIDQFNREWKQKYGRDFHITEPQLVFADITPNDILAGPAQIAAGHVPGKPAPATSPPTTAPAAVTTAPASDDEANVNVPPVLGSAAIIVRVVRLNPGVFKFACSGSIDPKHLAVSLQAHLQSAMDQRARWPIDASQGQRFVTQYVLMALSKSGDGAADVTRNNAPQTQATTTASEDSKNAAPTSLPAITQ